MHQNIDDLRESLVFDYFYRKEDRRWFGLLRREDPSAFGRTYANIRTFIEGNKTQSKLTNSHLKSHVGENKDILFTTWSPHQGKEIWDLCCERIKEKKGEHNETSFIAFYSF